VLFLLTTLLSSLLLAFLAGSIFIVVALLAGSVVSVAFLAGGIFIVVAACSFLSGTVVVVACSFHVPCSSCWWIVVIVVACFSCQ